jgi:hypothetical protein
MLLGYSQHVGSHVDARHVAASCQMSLTLQERMGDRDIETT